MRQELFSGTRIGRRRFLYGGSLAAASLVIHGCGSEPAAENPTVETAGGSVKGMTQNGVHAFKGIPYGMPTGGGHRFLQPMKAAQWSGVRDAVDMGPEAMQVITPLPEYFASLAPANPPLGEDCLNLHVWTPGVDNARRPVMVWLHGGGYSVSSANWPIYDGANLASHDVVVVTLNHRLNLFGFLHLADLGVAKYAASSNMGMMDIVMALQWVRDNIANFGGDPGNVTIFGESGGAGKVSTLMGMPAAMGLFHRAIVQSGAALDGIPADAATKATEQYLAKLNLKKDQLDQLQQLSVTQLLDGMQGVPGLAAGPVVDGRTLPMGAFTPSASTVSADLPLLIGSNATETTGLMPTVSAEDLTDSDLLKSVKETLGGVSDAKAKHVIEAYKNADLSNREISLRLAADVGMRADVMTEAERKSEQGIAPVFVYYLSWKTPVDGGKFLSPHTLDLPFVFDNLDRARDMVGSGEAQNALRDRMVGAWVAFAKSGNPSHAGLPEWTAFDLASRDTMILDNECRLVSDPHREQREAVAAARA